MADALPAPGAAEDDRRTSGTRLPSATEALRGARRILVRRRRLAAGSVAAMLALTLLVTALTPRRYTASTRVQVATGSTTLGAEVSALESRDLAERVILERGLLADPRLRPDGHGATATVTAAMLDRYTSFLAVRAVPGSDSVEIAFTTPSPMLSAALALAHAETYQAMTPPAPRSPIDPPQLPRWPSRPDVALNLALGLGAGVLLAAGTVLARELGDTTFRTPEQVGDALGLPVLAAIPTIDLGSHAGALPPRARTAVDEAVRGLLPSTASPMPGVVLVTSAATGEGKTMAATNLAVALAEAGTRVLLIDANLRRPRCHDVFRVPNTRGLATYLTGASDVPTLLQQLEVPRLSFIAAGSLPEDPTTLLGSGHVRGLLSRLRREYDCVVLDAPSVLVASETLLLARDADAVLLVVRAGATPGGVVARASERLATVGAHVRGAILNDVPACGPLP